MDRQEPDQPTSLGQPLSRRSLLRGVGAGSLAVGAGGLLAACSSGIKGSGSGGAATAGTITIGFITPLTGALAGFASGDRFVLNQVMQSPAFKKGIKVGGKTYKFKINVQDSQSSPTRAAQVAQQLVLSDHVDMVLTTSTPETTNPVAAACEKFRAPCLSTVVPWESWYAGLGGNPLQPTQKFQYCAVFFFGLKEFQGCFAPMWNRVHSNKVVGCQYPNDADGNAFRGGFEPLIKASGYKVVDGGAYPDGQTSFASMISGFKSKECEIFSNCPLPPDFNTFWTEAHSQGYKPKLATVAKVLLFPADTKVLGPLVNNIATDSWWGPYMPNQSSLTGQSAKDLADAYTAATGNQWVQSIGSTYSLFEVAAEAFGAVSDPHDKAEVASALHNVNYTGMCGPLDFASGPAPGVGIIQPLGVQWRKSTGTFPFEMTVVDNSLNKSVPIGGDLEPTNA
ncbi:MAG TPA: ABC transporter substrate-binding protein [Streptosporangiaceae bacterium]|nr:ABC transporter substrate-binding protein [Streptosporangiaceae bacterium]